MATDRHQKNPDGDGLAIGAVLVGLLGMVGSYLVGKQQCSTSGTLVAPPSTPPDPATKSPIQTTNRPGSQQAMDLGINGWYIIGWYGNEKSKLFQHFYPYEGFTPAFWSSHARAVEDYKFFIGNCLVLYRWDDVFSEWVQMEGVCQDP